MAAEAERRLEQESCRLHGRRMDLRAAETAAFFATYPQPGGGSGLVPAEIDHFPAANSDDEEADGEEEGTSEPGEQETMAELASDLVVAFNRDYELTRRLHLRSESVVYAARTRWSGFRVALKIHRDARVRGTPREIRVLARLQGHPSVATLVAWHPLPAYNTYAVATALVATDHPHEGPAAEAPDLLLPPELVPRYVRGLLEALAHMHARGVLCRDVKPSNFLWTGERVVAVDFDLCAFLDGRPLLSAAGTDGYRAPEVLDPLRACGRPSDVFSAGVVLAQMLLRVPEALLGDDPGAGHSPAALLRRLSHDNFGGDLVRRMLEPDPARRATVPQALGHPFLRFG